MHKFGVMATCLDSFVIIGVGWCTVWCTVVVSSSLLVCAAVLLFGSASDYSYVSWMGLDLLLSVIKPFLTAS